MEIQEYLKTKKELYKIIIDFIDNGEEEKKIYDFIENHKINNNRDDFKELLQMIVKIFENHYRNHDFIYNFKNILLYYQEDIKNSFSNSEIYDIFKNSKLILLFLFQNKLITVDEEIYNNLIKERKNNYPEYFLPEIESFLKENKNKCDSFNDNEFINISSDDLFNFDKKRAIGENTSIICDLIRKDEIKDFIIYKNRNIISSSSLIPLSIFETNSFLLEKKETSLIEYAAFFGSIQVFQFLKMNNAKLKASLWLYAIHGRNADIIHLLEENHIHPRHLFDDIKNHPSYYHSFQPCLEESIKCHHNEIAQYILYNKITDQNVIEIINNDYHDSYCSKCFHHNNFSELFDSYINFDQNTFIFYYACQFNYMKIVKLCIKHQKFNFFNLKNNLSVFSISLHYNNKEIYNLLMSLLGNKILPKSFYQNKKIQKIGSQEDFPYQISIPTNIIILGCDSFSECSILKEVIIPSSVTRIEDHCFSHCESLISISIPSSVEFLGKGVFECCSSLTHIEIPSSISKIPKDTFSCCTSLKNVSIPSSVTSIGKSAFHHCIQLQNIEIPASVTDIGEMAFMSCRSLEIMYIPYVQSIGYLAFHNCFELSEITISHLIDTDIEGGNCNAHIYKI